MVHIFGHEIFTTIQPTTMIEITAEKIDVQTLLDAVHSVDAGASVLFTGSTRRWTDDRETTHLEYECYHEMAISEMKKMVDQAHAKWNLVKCAIAHRVGTVGLGENSVAIAVSAAHRDAAFEAGRWLIDTLKEVVPIWKKENWADGSAQWVHPGKESQLGMAEQHSDQRNSSP
jgi:molybdopterin synthase catalytic subunit